MDPASLSLLQSAVHDEEQRDLAMGELSGAQLSQPQSPGAKSKKRKSIDGGETAVPEKKKRSSIACTNCRSRKVRCDVERSERVNDAGERVCNNCAIDGIQCLVPGSKRRRLVLQTIKVIILKNCFLYWHMQRAEPNEVVPMSPPKQFPSKPTRMVLHTLHRRQIMR